MAEEKKYLDYEGLAYLVGKLTDRIEAAGSGGAADGVYVGYTDSGGVNRIAKPDEYGGEGTFCGLVVVEGSVCLLVSPENPGEVESFNEHAWGGSIDTGGYMTEEETYAENDFDGRENTKAAWDSGATGSDGDPGTGTAMELVRDCSYGTVGPGKWHLPSVGEMRVIVRHMPEMDKYNGMSFTGYYWTSTQFSNDDAWYMIISAEYDGSAMSSCSGEIRMTGKDSSSLSRGTVPLQVRAVAEFHFVR